MKLQISLKDGFSKVLEELEKCYMREIESIFPDIVQGRPFLAQRRLEDLMEHLTQFYAELVKTAREHGSPEAELAS